MHSLYYVGLDVHKKSISYSVKTADGTRVDFGSIRATRTALAAWVEALPGPWVGALEAALFTGWIHDFLEPFAVDLQIAHPAMLQAIACAKKKGDRLDADKICDLLRYRNLLVRQAVRLKNRISGVLMEVGEPYNKKPLHGKAYFYELLDHLQYTPESAIELLAISRGMLETFQDLEGQPNRSRASARLRL